MPSLNPSIHFVTGSDEMLVKTTASHLEKSLISDPNPLAREIIDGAAENVDEAVECLLDTVQSLLTFPFFQTSKLVWLKNASMLTDSIIGRSESVGSVLEKLQHVLEQGLPEKVIFLLSAPAADKRRSFYKALVKLAKITVCDKPNFGWNATEADISEWLRKKGSQRGLSFTPSALDLLTVRIGSDTRQAETEFEKLSTALPPQSSNAVITETHIRELVPATRESNIFDLSNALLSRDINLCLNSLQQLFSQGEQAIGILLVAIVPTLRNLLIVKDLLEHHNIRPPQHAGAFAAILARLPSESTLHLPKKKDGTINIYSLSLAGINCNRYSLPELQQALQECLETNRLLISAPLDGRIVLTRLLLRVVGQPISQSL